MKSGRKIFWVLVLSLGLRLIFLNQSLWLDEAIGALVVRDFSFWEVLTKFPLTDNHPPLYYLILKAWTGVFGYSEISLRAPSVIAGVLTVYFVYLVSREFFKSKTSLIPAIFLATSPLHIYYSQEARMYALAGLFATMAVHYFSKTLKNKATRDNWIMFSLSILLLVFTDYLPALMIPVFWVFALVFKKDKKWWKRFLISHVPLFILGLFWIPIFLIQSERGRWLLETLPAWKQIAGGANLKEILLVWAKFVLGRISLMDKNLYAVLIFFFSIPFALSFFKATKKKPTIFHFWLTLPLLLGFLISFFVPAFTFFRFIFVLPAFYLLAYFGIETFRSESVRKYLTGIILLGNVLGLSVYYADDSQHREDWRGAVRFVRSQKDIPALFVYPEPFAPYRWYSLGDTDTISVTNTISPEPGYLIENTIEKIMEEDKIYYFEYLVDLTDPGRLVESTIKSQGFVIKEIKNFRGVGQVYLYTK